MIRTDDIDAASKSKRCIVIDRVSLDPEIWDATAYLEHELRIVEARL